MTRNRKGGFKKDGDFVEVTLMGGDCYQDVVAKSCEALGVDPDPDTETATLLRMSGSRVLDQPIHNGPRVMAWSMKSYMDNVLGKSTKVKFGIALVEVCRVCIYIKFVLYGCERVYRTVKVNT